MQANDISIKGNLFFIPKQYLSLLNLLEDYIEAISKENLSNSMVHSNSMFVVDDERQRQKMTAEFYANYKRDIEFYQDRIRNSTKYVSYKDIKVLMADLKRVYGAIDEETALYDLENFAEKWGAKYPKISVSRRAHLAEHVTYFKYPQSVRTLIYTTNAIENFNRQLRKATKGKAVFPPDYHSVFYAIFRVYTNCEEPKNSCLLCRS